MGETRRITTWAEGAGDKQLQHLQVINSNLQAADRCFSLLGVRCDGVVVGCGVCGEHLETPVVVSDDGVAEIRCGGRLEEKEWKTLNRTQARMACARGAATAPLAGSGLAPTARPVRRAAGGPAALARLLSASTLGRLWAQSPIPSNCRATWVLGSPIGNRSL